MSKLFKVLMLAVSFAVLSQAEAAVSPLGVSLAPPAQFPPGDFTIAGARLDILWGKHRSVYGLDLGAIGNITEQNSGGIQVAGVFNMNQGMTTVVGLQAAGGANINVNKASIYGLQVALGVNSNQAESTAVGFQIAGLANTSPFTRVIGAQVGIYNRAKEVYGFQIGVVNVVDNLHGIQIGLVNYNLKGLLYVAPILNIGF